MTHYIDSSALVAVYVTERFSKSARRALRAVPQVPYTQLHDLEVQNALELLVGRGVITREECRRIRVQLLDDIEHQRLVRLSIDLNPVFADAHELSRVHTSKHLSRSLDLLHIAAARAASCTTFISADDRQLAVAKTTGLVVIDIKRRIS